MLHTIHEYVEFIAMLGIDLLELLSIIIVITSATMAFYNIIKKGLKAKVYLLNGLSLGLTFKLGSEILRTITVHNMDEILQIAALIAIKAAMTALISWELSEKKIEFKPNKNHDA